MVVHRLAGCFALASVNFRFCQTALCYGRTPPGGLLCTSLAIFVLLLPPGLWCCRTPRFHRPPLPPTSGLPIKAPLLAYLPAWTALIHHTTVYYSPPIYRLPCYGAAPINTLPLRLLSARPLCWSTGRPGPLLSFMLLFSILLPRVAGLVSPLLALPCYGAASRTPLPGLVSS